MSDLAGIRKDSCPTACNLNHCVIGAGRPLCMHPCMSGVPHQHKNDAAIQKIYAQACTVLGVKNVHEITQGIARMTDQQQQPTPPANAVEARAQLDSLMSNADFSSKLLAGSGPETNQWRDLQTMIAGGDDVEIAMSGALPDVPDSNLKQLSGTADMLRDAGFTPKAIREVLSNQEAPQADVDRATVWKNQALKNPEFTKRWLGGDPDAAREMLVANAILSLPIKKEGKA